MELGQNKFMKAEVGKDTEFTEKELIKGRNIISDSEIDKKRRKSKVTWVEKDWVYKLINPFMLEANKKSGWNFDITASESPQLTKYEKDFFPSFIHHQVSPVTKGIRYSLVAWFLGPPFK